MAGQAQRGSRGHGRSSRPGSSSLRAAAASVAAPGATPAQTSPRRRTAEPTAPALATRPLYRLLQMKGMTPAEAANLTAFMCGLPATSHDWSLKQINQLLFLRQMQQTGRFGRTDGKPKLAN
jgi:hypothetical protein